MKSLTLATTFILFFVLIAPSLSKATEVPTALVHSMKIRNEQIEAREKKVVEREARLNLLEHEIRDMLDEYVRLKKIIDDSNTAEVLALKEAEEKRIARLAKIYQSMKPKEAADRIQKMKKTTAITLLRRFKEKQTAKILTSMSPTKATQYSEALINADK